MNAMERIYPGAKIVGLDQLYVELEDGRHLWYDTLVSTVDDTLAIARNGHDAYGRRILMMGIILIDGNGFRRVADFRPHEIL